MQILKFNSILKTVVWGGEKIAPFKNIQTDQNNIGESWEISGVKGNESVVINGELAGKSISELVREYKGKLIGEKVWENTGEEFPLLIKFIDARDDLSIQVHPDDKLAGERHNGSKGKTEMWYVVGVDEDAHLMAGLSENITPDEYSQRVENDTITSVLKDYKVKVGDVFFLPAGRIHSIGTGCFIAEIQQTSDITYRIYDFNRPGLDGQPRELHTELSKDAIDYTVLEDYRTKYEKVEDGETKLVSCNYFTTNLLDINTPFSKKVQELDSFLIAICISGEGQVLDSEGNATDIKQGETILVPADTSYVTFIPSGDQKILLTWIG